MRSGIHSGKAEKVCQPVPVCCLIVTDIIAASYVEFLLVVQALELKPQRHNCQVGLHTLALQIWAYILSTRG